MCVSATFRNSESQWNAMVCRVSKSGRHTDMHLRKMFHNVRKILPFERKTVKITSFNLISLILMHFFCVLWPFRAHFRMQFFLPGHFACVMKIVFRKSSGVSCGWRTATAPACHHHGDHQTKQRRILLVWFGWYRHSSNEPWWRPVVGAPSVSGAGVKLLLVIKQESKTRG